MQITELLVTVSLVKEQSKVITSSFYLAVSLLQ